MLPRFVRCALAAAALAAALPRAAEAQRPEDYDYTNLAFTGVGADVFRVWPNNAEPALALRARADLGSLGPNVRIVPSLTYWKSDVSRGEVARIEERIEAACQNGGVPCPGIALGDIEVSDLALEVDAHYLWTTDLGVEPYAGLGAGIHLLNGRGDFIDDTFVDDLLDAIAPGFSALAGVEVPLTPELRLHGEVRGTLAGNTRWLGVGVGGTLSFPAARPAPSATRTLPR